MEIVVLHKPEGRVIGRELQVNGAEGDFILTVDGTVVYRSPYDEKTWYVAPSAETFKRSAECWSRYADRVKSASSKAPDAATQLIKFLTGPAAIPVIRAQGMEPAP